MAMSAAFKALQRICELTLPFSSTVATSTGIL